MTWGAVAGAGASLIGGMMSGDAAGEAAGAQTQASREATQLQREQYEQTRADNAGYRQRGEAAGNRLAYMMGLQPSATGQSYNKTADQFRQELMGQYTRGPATIGPTGYIDDYEERSMLDSARHLFNQQNDAESLLRSKNRMFQFGEDYSDKPGWDTYSGGGSQIDEAGLNAAIQAAMAQQERDRLAAEQAASGDASYGSLLRNFSASDLSSDPLYALQKPLIDAAMQRASSFETAPGYQFRKEEGQKGVENSAAARGGLLSGAALKAIQRYGQDFASNEYGNWFNQSNADRNYIAGQGDASYNRFNTGTTNQYNRLAGLSGTGQQATNQVNTAGANYANQAAQNTMGAGNAQAAGIVGQANALSGGLTGAYNAYQNNQLMNLIRNPQQTNYSGTIPMQPGGGY